MEHQAIVYDYVIWIKSPQDSVQWRGVMDMKMNIWLRQKAMELIDQQRDYQFLKVIAPMELIRRSASKRFTRIRDNSWETDLKI